MNAFRIVGGKELTGTVKISGAKNAALPIMVATLLAPGKTILHNVPDLKDVATMSDLLRLLGAEIEFRENVLTVDTSNVTKTEAPYELVKTMRASIYVLGPLLARFGRAKVSLPGGCAWGPRPVDLHIKGMQELGAEIDVEHGYIVAKAKRLRGARINFDISSVGATGNVMMAAVLAQGTTHIENASREPEIVALAKFLKKMGAHVAGEGTDTIEIEGIGTLSNQEEKIIPDRIETGTFMAAVAITGGEATVEDCIAEHVSAVTAKLNQAGVQIEEEKTALHIKAPKHLDPVDVTTAPYPGFPTDLQAQMMALLSIADGTSVITETIFSDRFNHAPELQRLGADVKVDENVAVVTGVESLSGAPVMATDIRASAALVLAGLVAEGETTISRVYHIDRGYENIEGKLRNLGAQIERIREE